jgi:hypothetical protein
VATDGVDDLLPVPYRLALTLVEEGLDRDAIAARLGVDLDAVETMVELGRAKLDRLAGLPDGTVPSGHIAKARGAHAGVAPALMASEPATAIAARRSRTLGQGPHC